MWIVGKEWNPENDDVANRVVALVNDHLSSKGRQRILRYQGRNNQTYGHYHARHRTKGKSSESSLVVNSVSKQRLSFYPKGWCLYRLDCSIGGVSEMEGYKNIAYAYAVCNLAFNGPERCTLLDWTSQPIHHLNEILKLDLSSGQDVNENALRYVVFFSTFLGNDADPRRPIKPFFLPQKFDDLNWHDSVVSLDQWAQRAGLKPKALDINVNHPDKPDMFDDNSEGAKRYAPESKRTVMRAPENLRELISKAFESHPSSLSVTSSSSNLGAHPQTDNAALPNQQAEEPVPSIWRAKFKGFLSYGDTLYTTELDIEKDGNVTMIADDPYPDATTLPFPRWEVRGVLGCIRLLCRQKSREDVPFEKLYERLTNTTNNQGVTANKGSHRLRGLRVIGDFVYPADRKGSLSLEDVEFTGNVVLDDMSFDGSLAMTDCRFLRRLSARNATIKGSFHLEDSRVDDAHFEGQQENKRGFGSNQPPPALDFRGIRIERGLFADRLIAFGRVRIDWARITGPVRMRGLQVHNETSGSYALKLSHAQIDGPLDLSSNSSKRNDLTGRRTYLLGPARLIGVRAHHVDLSGIRFEDELDLEHADIPGSLCLGVTPENENTRDNFWRAFVRKNVVLANMKVGQIELNSCWVDGEVSLVGVQLAHSLLAGPAWHEFRTRVGGTLTLSGADVKGDIELEGAKIDGEILFVTGRCGRLRCAPYQFVLQSKNAKQPTLCPMEAEGIWLQEVSVAGSIYLTGLKLRTGPRISYSNGGIVAQGVTVNGSFFFWRGNVSIDLIKKKFKELDSTIDSDLVDAEIEKICAEIDGSLDFRGIRVNGSIDLSRSKVSGNVLLDNSRIEGNVITHYGGSYPTCSAQALSMNIARIGGDIDARNLELSKGNLIARDMEVKGQVLFDTPKNGTSPDLDEGGKVFRTLVKAGMIDLSGSQASRLVIGSENIGKFCSTNNKAAISLASCRFGQLTVRGFGTKRFPRTVDLNGITVGDWDVDPRKEALQLLQATRQHFDGRNFVDIEERLAKIGQKKEADKIYRSMLWYGATSKYRKFIFVANWLFSRNGTQPLRMFFWLLGVMLCVVYVLRDPSNVELRPSSVSSTSPVAGNFVSVVSGGRAIDPKRDWGWIGSISLAASYATPFSAGFRQESFRPRLVEPTCFLNPSSYFTWRRDAQVDGSNPHSSKPATAFVNNVKDSEKNMTKPGDPSFRCEGISGPFSPDSWALGLSMIQFVLWLFIAANLPAITRRRS